MKPASIANEAGFIGNRSKLHFFALFPAFLGKKTGD